MLARLMIVVVLLSTTGLVGCGETATNFPTAPPAPPMTKDAKGKDLPKGVAAPESPF